MDPTYELIKACFDALKADPKVIHFVDDKIFDRVPEKQSGVPNVTSPYISLGNTNLITEVSDEFNCVDATSISIQFHCWSWGVDEAYGTVEVRKLANVVRKCLHKRQFDLTHNGFVSLEHQVTNFGRASDGVTNQASLTFEALIDVINSDDFS